MPKFFSYQRPAPVNKQAWGGKPGYAYGPIRKPAKVAETELKVAGKLPKLPALPARH